MPTITGMYLSLCPEDNTRKGDSMFTAQELMESEMLLEEDWKVVVRRIRAAEYKDRPIGCLKVQW